MGNIHVIRKFILLLTLVYTIVGAGASDWNYERNGDDWLGTCASGKQQSPIALIKSKSDVFAFPQLNFDNYDLSLGGSKILINNGHSAKLHLYKSTSEGFPYISGGGLSNKYEAESVVFHWGSPYSRGSEHVINGERYDLEMHIVHKNKRSGDGIAVLGVMFKIADNPNSNRGLDKIFNKIHDIQSARWGRIVTEQLTLGELIDDLNTQEFYNYNGSLTTPGCKESVTWFVYPNALKIPEIQMSRLWNLNDDIGKPILNNYRSLQPLNNRLVYYNSAGYNTFLTGSFPSYVFYLCLVHVAFMYIL